MARFETSMGGPGRSFPTTIWSDIIAARDPASPESRDRMGLLLQAYWKPVYGYIRASWNKPVEEAKDLTQAFLMLVLEKGYVERLKPGPGSFRGYLKQALKNFLIDHKRAEIVRGAIKPAMSLDAPPDEFERIGPESPGDDPEQVYHREWFRSLMERAVVELKRSFIEDGKEAYFEVFRSYYLEDRPEAEPNYKEIAASLSLKETDVRNYLTAGRRALERILRERIREYVTSESEVDDELREILRP